MVPAPHSERLLSPSSVVDMDVDGFGGIMMNHQRLVTSRKSPRASISSPNSVSSSGSSPNSINNDKTKSKLYQARLRQMKTLDPPLISTPVRVCSDDEVADGDHDARRKKSSFSSSSSRSVSIFSISTCDDEIDDDNDKNGFNPFSIGSRSSKNSRPSTTSSSNNTTSKTSCGMKSSDSRSSSSINGSNPTKHFDNVYDLFDELKTAGLPKSKHEELESILQMGDKFFTMLDDLGVAKDISSIGFERRRIQQEQEQQRLLRLGKKTTSSEVAIETESDTSTTSEEEDDEDTSSFTSSNSTSSTSSNDEEEDDIFDDDDDHGVYSRRPYTSSSVKGKTSGTSSNSRFNKVLSSTSEKGQQNPRRSSLPSFPSSQKQNQTNRKRRTSLPSDIERQRRILGMADRATILVKVKQQQLMMNKFELIKGIPASIGIRKGYARIIKSSDDLNHIQQGDILILRSGTSSLLTSNNEKLKYQNASSGESPNSKIKGICAEDGGMLCNAAFVARELGIPAVVGVTTRKGASSSSSSGSKGISTPTTTTTTPGALTPTTSNINTIRKIQNGDYIQIDGYVGTVKLL